MTLVNNDKCILGKVDLIIVRGIVSTIEKREMFSITPSQFLKVYDNMRFDTELFQYIMPIGNNHFGTYNNNGAIEVLGHPSSAVCFTRTCLTKINGGTVYVEAVHQFHDMSLLWLKQFAKVKVHCGNSLSAFYETSRTKSLKYTNSSILYSDPTLLSAQIINPIHGYDLGLLM